MSLRMSIVGLVLLCAAGAVAWLFWPKRGPDAQMIERAYADPLPVPDAPLRVFHLGHSLVGRDMPAMLAQLADAGDTGAGHTYDSQLGWGTSLRDHWEPDHPINGFEAENAHPRYRDAQTAIGSGEYDAVILTEMVEIKDAIKYHASGKYLRKWADLARSGDPTPQIYLYETWHKLDDPNGWLARLDGDLERYWLRELLYKDLAANPDNPIHLIPAGQVMAHVTRRLEAAGGVGNAQTRDDLFARDAAGALDPIHLNDLGAYLVALTHYAVLYHRAPVGLPHALLRADGTPATAPTPDLALMMQHSVWEVVQTLPMTGVARETPQ